MMVLKQLFNFYLNSSIHVALAVTSFTCITVLTLNLNFDTSLLYFVFFTTILGYNFVKYFGVAKFHQKRLTGNLNAIQIVSFISLVFIFYFANQLQFKTLIYMAFFTLITVFYAIPFLPKYKNSSLRNISGIKIYVIALIWTGVTVIVPVVNADCELSADVMWLVLQQGIYIVVLMLPFEIRDLKFDNQKLATIPQKIGVPKTKLLGILLLVFFFLMEFLKDNTNNVKIIALLLVVIVTGLFVHFSKKEQNKYYCSFFVEGLPVFWLVLLIMFNC